MQPAPADESGSGGGSGGGGVGAGGSLALVVADYLASHGFRETLATFHREAGPLLASMAGKSFTLKPLETIVEGYVQATKREAARQAANKNGLYRGMQRLLDQYSDALAAEVSKNLPKEEPLPPLGAAALRKLQRAESIVHAARTGRRHVAERTVAKAALPLDVTAPPPPAQEPATAPPSGRSPHHAGRKASVPRKRSASGAVGRAGRSLRFAADPGAAGGAPLPLPPPPFPATGLVGPAFSLPPNFSLDDLMALPLSQNGLEELLGNEMLQLQFAEVVASAVPPLDAWAADAAQAQVGGGGVGEGEAAAAAEGAAGGAAEGGGGDARAVPVVPVMQRFSNIPHWMGLLVDQTRLDAGAGSDAGAATEGASEVAPAPPETPAVASGGESPPGATAEAQQAGGTPSGADAEGAAAAAPGGGAEAEGAGREGAPAACEAEPGDEAAAADSDEDAPPDVDSFLAGLTYG